MNTAIKIQGGDAIAIWESVEPYFQRVLEKGKVVEYDTANILDRIEIGALHLFVIFDTELKEIVGAYTMSFARYANMDTATIVHFSADSMDMAVDCWPKMIEYAQQHGAQKISIKGRKGWGPILKEHGFEASSVYYARAI